MKNIIIKVFILFGLLIGAILFIGTCVNHLNAATVTQIIDRRYVYVTLKSVDVHAEKNGLTGNMPQGVTSTAGYAGYVNIDGDSKKQFTKKSKHCIIKIKVRVDMLDKYRQFLKLNNIDAGANTEPAYTPVFK